MLPIVVISLLGGLSQGVLCIYASGLDLEGLTPRLKRTQTTIITAAVAIVLLYLGVFVFDAVDSVTAMTDRAQRRHHAVGGDPGDRRAAHAKPTTPSICRRSRRVGAAGRYWFTGGWNVPAVSRGRSAPCSAC